MLISQYKSTWIIGLSKVLHNRDYICMCVCMYYACMRACMHVGTMPILFHFSSTTYDYHILGLSKVLHGWKEYLLIQCFLTKSQFYLETPEMR